MDLSDNPSFFKWQDKFVPTPELVCRYVGQTVGNSASSEVKKDIVQDVMLRCLEKGIPSLPPGVAPEKWVSGVIKNVWRERCRNDRLRTHQQLNGFQPPAHVDDGAAQRTDRLLLLADLRAISQLTRRELELFLLGRESSYGQSEELARLAGMSVSAFHSAKSRILAKVRMDGGEAFEDAERQLALHFNGLMNAGQFGVATAVIAANPKISIEDKVSVALADFYLNALIAACVDRNSYQNWRIIGRGYERAHKSLPLVGGRQVKRWGARVRCYLDGMRAFIHDIPLFADGEPWYAGLCELPMHHLFLYQMSVGDEPDTVSELLQALQSTKKDLMLFLHAAELIERIGYPGSAITLFDKGRQYLESEAQFSPPFLIGTWDAVRQILDEERRKVRAIV